MPVHWFYRPGDILRAFPPAGITGFEAAPERHPGSIMSLHSTSGGGRSAARRGASGPDVVGDVILRGRRHLWDTPGVHYHHGLPAGENTLNAWCARWLIDYLVEHDGYEATGWFERYEARMTAEPPAHPDTYAESYHRGFFANRVAGKPLLDCGAVTHDTPSMGALVTLLPLALWLLREPLEDAAALDAIVGVCQRHVSITHPDDKLGRVVVACVRLCARLLERASTAGGSDVEGADAVRAALLDAASALPGNGFEPLLERAEAGRLSDADVVGGRYSLACYIDDSWPSVCFLAARHGTDATRALLANANLGGENAHRGFVLGALCGLVSGCVDDALSDDLAGGPDLLAGIDAFAGV